MTISTFLHWIWDHPDLSNLLALVVFVGIGYALIPFVRKEE